MKYQIYAGLKGNLGGAQYQFTDEFDSMEDALSVAKSIAADCFFDHIGSHGYRSWDDFDKQAKESFYAENNKDAHLSERELSVISSKIASCEMDRVMDFRVEIDSLDSTEDSYDNKNSPSNVSC